MSTANPLRPAFFRFLTDLAAHNDRTWFKANQERYERDVREPALAFVRLFEDRLEDISPHFVADPRKVGGSLFRIQRDTRFSKDKSPYKTNTGLHFRHESAKDVHAPGFYLHLEPGQCFLGVGIWHPDPTTAGRLREGLAADPQGWKKATRGAAFRRSFELTGDSLKRPPRGFDPDHELIDDLKLKDFCATARLTQRQVTAATFPADLARAFRTGAPLVRFLCGALDLPA